MIVCHHFLMRDAVPGLLCALSLYAGICLGLQLESSAASDGLIDGVLLFSLAGSGVVFLLRSKRWLAFNLVLVIVACLGLVLGGDTVARIPKTSAVGLAGDGNSLVQVRARLLQPFAPPDPSTSDLLDRFQPQDENPLWQSRAELVAWVTPTEVIPCLGVVSISAPAAAHALQTGSVIQGCGWLTQILAPDNPGELDRRVFGWRNHLVGRIRMEVAPIVIEPASHFDRIRSRVQRWVDQNLTSSLGVNSQDPVRTLVVAMTTGRRLPGYGALRTRFANTGLSHFLAISGFNVAVLFAAVVVGMELLRVPGGLRGWVLATVGLGFLFVVDLEVSVLRAGVAGVMAGTSLALGRGWRADGLLAAAAIGTLIVDPWMAHNVGFQLSYAAVLALRYGSGPVDRVLGLLCPTINSRRAVWLVLFGRCVRLALAASLAAWLVSTPITLFAFGRMSPWCAVVSTVLGPLAALITVVASLASIIGGTPLVGWVAGLVLWASGWLFLWCVEMVEALPACTVVVDPFVWWWMLLALGSLCWLWIVPFGRQSLSRCGVIAVTLAVWMVAPILFVLHNTQPADTSDLDLRWVSLSIGDGSVHLLQSGGESILFDAGSISRSTIGSSVVVPALRSLGVVQLKAIVVSHPHLDHFSAVPEVVRTFPVGCVMVSESWKTIADSESAPGVLLDWLRLNGVPLVFLAQNDVFRQGPIQWRVLHPPRGFTPATINDGSLGVVLTHDSMAHRPVAVFWGDAQDQAIARYLNRADLVMPWAMELPHHGGWRPIAQQLCEWVRPSFVVQSTGPRRFLNDRFAETLKATTRGVTCRDGAIRFTLTPTTNPPAAKLERWGAGEWQELRPQS